MKQFIQLFLATLLLAVFSPADDAFAQSQHRVPHYNYSVFKRSVAVGTGNIDRIDEYSSITIGDTMVSRYNMWLKETDTSKVALANRKFGHLLFQRSDTSVRLWVGDRFRKVQFEAEE